MLLTSALLCNKDLMGAYNRFYRYSILLAWEHDDPNHCQRSITEPLILSYSQDVRLHQPEPLPAVRRDGRRPRGRGHAVGGGGQRHLPRPGAQAGLRGEHPGSHQAVLHQPGQDGQGAALRHSRGEERKLSGISIFSVQTRSFGYNAFERDISILNIYFGDSTVMGLTV